jgi:hypothetical protein
MSSPRVQEYRELISDVVAGGLLEEDEREELHDLLARIQRRMLAKMPAEPPKEEVG